MTNEVQFNGIEIGVTAGQINPGDTITITPNPDRRNWWRRRAPRWLGGKEEPKPFVGIISAVVAGDSSEYRQSDT